MVSSVQPDSNRSVNNVRSRPLFWLDFQALIFLHSKTLKPSVQPSKQYALSEVVSEVEWLASHIECEIGRGQTQCAIYEQELQRLWPLDQKDRESKIAQFAKNYGFRLRLYKKGLCAIFDKWPRGHGDATQGRECESEFTLRAGGSAMLQSGQAHSSGLITLTRAIE